MKDITFAVVGSGLTGNVLVKAASELPYTNYLGAADVELTRARKLIVTYGGNAYQDFHEMLDKEYPQAVITATPEHDHLEPVIIAADHGAQVFGKTDSHILKRC